VTGVQTCALPISGLAAQQGQQADRDQHQDIEDVGEHLESNRHDKVKLLFATGHPETNTGKIVKKHDGVILKLRGIEGGMNEDKYKDYGILGDGPECGLTVALQGITEINYKKLDPSEFKPIVEKRLERIGRKIDETVPLPFFRNLTFDMVTSSNLFLGGYAGLARTVSEAACIRDHQAKSLVPGGGSAQVMGEPGTNPTSPGDAGLWTSYSGGPTYTVDWCNLLQ
jgi:hypothetical protein